MSNKYYLPCSCGKKIAIQVSQSGQTVQCECGRQLDVPTMLQIRALEPVEEAAPEPPHRSWGARQALVLLGSVVALIAAGAAIALFINRPVPLVAPTAEQLREGHTQHLSLLQTFQEWERLEAGLNRNAAERVDAGLIKIHARYRNWMGVVLVLGLLGIGCAAAGLLMPRTPQQPHDMPDSPEQDVAP